MQATKTVKKGKKESAFDLTHKRRELEEKFDKMLLESGGELTDEIEELYQQIIDLDGGIADKVKSYQWVKRKLEAEVEAWNARSKYWQGVSDIDKKVRDSRKNNVENVKTRVVMLLRTQEDESVLVDGKKVYLRDFYKVGIIEEEKAYTHLREHGLASKNIELEEDQASVLSDSLMTIQSEMQTPDGEPIVLSSDAQLAIGKAIEVFQNASRKITFAPWKDLNKHGQELHEIYLRETAEARDRLQVIEGVLSQDPSEESREQLVRERSEIHEYLQSVEQVNSIPGAEIELNKSVFGL